MDPVLKNRALTTAKEILIACVNGQTIAINGEGAKEVADFYETLYNCALKLENDANS